ncbi:MAG: hypothetical protein KME15_01955 [Drouetiella hepatica Uher 2000/2452]|uniref:Uncharacterized protein n=1 Tax=Drouetiella hepatica Uher 2000/2452 TaxID=904376 RepID=A0A951UKN3_9CYAN|nr:hypothetical protein [Drouetiella hepatica Uher 2000/2452]
MGTSPHAQRSGSLIRKLLFHPMTLISLILHGAILSLPLLPTAKKAEPVPEKEKEEKISLTSLLPPDAAKPRTASAPRPAAAVVRPATAASAAVSATAPPPISAPPVAPPPAAAAPSAAPSATPAPPPSIDFGGSGSVGLCPNPQAFNAAQIGSFFTDPANPDSPPAAGITKIDWKTKPLGDVQNDLQALAASSNSVLQPFGDFGGAPLFAFQAPQGSIFLSLVPGKGNASTMQVTWSGDPNQLPAGTAALTRAQVCQ